MMAARELTWEPVPWDAAEDVELRQRAGFNARAAMGIVWTAVPRDNFPAEGLFGKSREGFIENDVQYYAATESEWLLLAENIWHGFPDPPRWCLISRPAGGASGAWEGWGCFDPLPGAWGVPGESEA
jgi:hypothetical protein